MSAISCRRLTCVQHDLPNHINILCAVQRCEHFVSHGETDAAFSTHEVRDDGLLIIVMKVLCLSSAVRGGEQVTPRLYKGTRVHHKDSPSFPQVFSKRPNRKSSPCGAAFIAKQWLLTAFLRSILGGWRWHSIRSKTLNGMIWPRLILRLPLLSNLGNSCTTCITLTWIDRISDSMWRLCS